MFELRWTIADWSPRDEETLLEMARISEKVEEYKSRKHLTTTVKECSELHFKECILVGQPWKDPRECYCLPIKISEETFLTLFKSLNFKKSQEETYNRLLDRINGKEDYIFPELKDWEENWEENTPLL